MLKVRNQLITENSERNIQLWMKRLDEVSPKGFGNKIYKLKYNLLEAKKLGCKTVLTFGGAYSNHIAALAQEAKNKGFKSIAIIRGEELGQNIEQTLQQNPTLSQAAQNGMQLEFISRSAYREKHTAAFKEDLINRFGPVYVLPEGGTNSLAVKGCEEILTSTDKSFDYICCPVGTGGTLSGIIRSATPEQQVLGFAALNADLTKNIEEFVENGNWELIPDTCFGGFAKINNELVSFINRFVEQHQIYLDPIYTGKMMYGILDRLKSGCFKENSRILAIHTGGLQGIAGMNQRLVKKNRPTIKYK